MSLWSYTYRRGSQSVEGRAFLVEGSHRGEIKEKMPGNQMWRRRALRGYGENKEDKRCEPPSSPSPTHLHPYSIQAPHPEPVCSYSSHHCCKINHSYPTQKNSSLKQQSLLLSFLVSRNSGWALLNGSGVKYQAVTSDGGP